MCSKSKLSSRQKHVTYHTMVVRSRVIIPNATNKEVLGNWDEKRAHMPEKKLQGTYILKLEAWCIFDISWKLRESSDWNDMINACLFDFYPLVNYKIKLEPITRVGIKSRMLSAQVMCTGRPVVYCTNYLVLFTKYIEELSNNAYISIYGKLDFFYKVCKLETGNTFVV